MPLYKFRVPYRGTSCFRKRIWPRQWHSTLSLHPPVSCLHLASLLGRNILLRLLIWEKTLFSFYILQHSDPFMRTIKWSEFSTISAARKVLKKSSFRKYLLELHINPCQTFLYYNKVESLEKSLNPFFLSPGEKRVYSLGSCFSSDTSQWYRGVCSRNERIRPITVYDHGF